MIATKLMSDADDMIVPVAVVLDYVADTDDNISYATGSPSAIV
jgi:hypothetical protein